MSVPVNCNFAVQTYSWVWATEKSGMGVMLIRILLLFPNFAFFYSVLQPPTTPQPIMHLVFF